MEQYLIDTNSVSDYFSASYSTEGISFMDAVIDDRPNLSVISQIELLSWKTDIDIERKTKDFISDSFILGISADVIALCVTLRRSKRIKTPDAIIAATALVNGYVLITNNENDFKNIKGLKIINPQKL